jgi:UDP-N-acetylglucosamine:LPS N-acetylglucosamine transferase
MKTIRNLAIYKADLPVKESAYEPAFANRDYQLRSIGLNPAWPVGFISAGEQKTRSILNMVRALAKQHRQLNLIILCGKDKALFSKLLALPLPFPTAVYSYISPTPLLFGQLSDFTIGQPGAKTINECHDLINQMQPAYRDMHIV